MNNEPGAVLIFGATRGTGFETAKVLAESGDRVTAVVRASSDTAELDALGVQTVVADIFDRASIDGVFSGGAYRAVVLSLSGKKDDPGPRPDREGVKVIVDSAKANGVRRVLMVTAIGCGDSKVAVAPKVIEVLGPVLAIKTEAEEYLVAADIDYTILRPGGMTSDPASGTAVRTTDRMTMGVINRADLGRIVADSIDDPGASGEIYHTVDPGLPGRRHCKGAKTRPPRPEVCGASYRHRIPLSIAG